MAESAFLSWTAFTARTISIRTHFPALLASARLDPCPDETTRCCNLQPSASPLEIFHQPHLIGAGSLLIVYAIHDLADDVCAQSADLYGVYFASGRLEIYTINVLLQNLLGWSLILVFIVFQNDIRRALTQVGTGPLFSSADRVAQSQAVEELVKGVTSMASRRVGALVVLQNEVGLNEYIEVGTRLDAQVSKELVSSIFMPGSPIHDGALIIQQGRITAAGW